ncbi:hypothetical protein DL768_010500 [Monosporascus sp. mg162]|nr:hypothetical protein DL768_010500 [Monosporascus sp. mg162]
MDFLNPSAIIESRTRRRKRKKPPSASTNYRLAPEKRNTYPTAFNAVFTAAIRPERLHRKDLPAAPKNWKEAIQHRYAEDWKAAAQRKWDQIYRVFTYKFNKNGFLQKFKAKLVVRGNLQPRKKLNAYVSTLAGRSFRMLMAVAARFNLDLRQLDAVNAFLHSNIDELVYFLKMRILRDRKAKKLWLMQDTYWEKIYSRFELSKFKKRHFKVPKWKDLKEYEGEAPAASKKLYLEKVGSLLYKAVTTRPDIAKAASHLSRYSKNPSPIHLDAVNKALLHGYHTRYLAIQYGKDEKPNGFLISLFGGPIV